MPYRESEMGRRDAGTLLEEEWRSHNPDRMRAVDPIWIAHRLGFEVFVAEMKPKASGALFLEPQSDGTVSKSIYLNEAEPRSRQRFSCAHELGHYFNKVNKKDLKGKHVEWRDERASLGRDPVERYANAFAAALLMPADVIQEMQAQGLSLASIALKLDVSPEALDNRISNMEYLAQ